MSAYGSRDDRLVPLCDRLPRVIIITPPASRREWPPMAGPFDEPRGVVAGAERADDPPRAGEIREEHRWDEAADPDSTWWHRLPH